MKKGKNNYKDSATVEWRITQYPLMEGLSKTEPNVPYDGKSHSPEVSVSSPADASVTYSMEENGTYTTPKPAFTTAGVYTVYYKIEKDGYEPETGTLTVTIYPGAEHNITFDYLRANGIQISQEK